MKLRIQSLLEKSQLRSWCDIYMYIYVYDVFIDKHINSLIGKSQLQNRCDI